MKLNTRLRNRLKIVLAGAALFMISMITFICIEGSRDTATFHEDAVVVLGCGIRGENVQPTLQRRLDRCLEYLQHNPQALVIVSGGQGYDEIIPEAEAMKRYLIDKGIDANQIVMEDQSRNTKENMQFSQPILENHFPHGYTAVCITSNYHAYRAKVLTARYGIPATFYSSQTAWYCYPVALCREVLAICKMWCRI